MSISIEVDLWTKPSWMMNIEGKNKINVKKLKEMSNWFKEYLSKISEIIDKLQKNNWGMVEGYGATYSLSFYKEEVNTEKNAKAELKKLGINSKDVSIFEWEDDEEDFEDE